MTRGFRSLPSVILMLVLIPSLAGAGGLNLAGVGAKGLAMSGAYRAIADDWSAMYWNPAGLAGQSSGFWIEGKVLYPVTTLTPNAPSAIPAYEGYYLYRNGVEQTSVSSAHPTGSIAFQYRMSERITLGVSAFTPSALGAEWKRLYLGPYTGYGETVPYPEKDWSSDMRVVDIHPTVGYWLTKRIRVGLGIAIKVTSIELQSPVLTPGINPATGDRLPLPGSEFFVDGVLKGDGTGYGFNLGMLADVTDKLHVGVAFNSPVTIPIKGDVRQTVYLPALAGGGTLEAKPDATADFPLPMDAGIGFAYQFNHRWTAAFDAVWTNWAALDKIVIKQDGLDASGAPAEDSDLILDWKNTIRFNLGAAFRVIEPLELRAGYYYDPTPIPDETLRPTISDVANKQSLSLGIAYTLNGNFMLEGYYEHLFSSENSARASDNDADGMFDNVPGAWKLNVDTIGLQVGYRF